MASLRCHGHSDCNKTQTVRIFLYDIQKYSQLYNTVVVTLFHIFTYADVVNAQTWEVSPLKPKRAT